jgi:hypothetical protein
MLIRRTKEEQTDANEAGRRESARRKRENSYNMRLERITTTFATTSSLPQRVGES